MEYVSRTQHYQKVKKPLLERQRRARINKCLDSLKVLVSEFQNDEAILRMDKAEMLETTIAYLRTNKSFGRHSHAEVPSDSFRHGYMNAVNEVSRVLASTRGVTVEFGKSVMTHLGCQFNRLQQSHQQKHQQTPVASHQMPDHMAPLTINTSSSLSAPLSPASSGYHSDMDSPLASPSYLKDQEKVPVVWRPW